MRMAAWRYLARHYCCIDNEFTNYAVLLASWHGNQFSDTTRACQLASFHELRRARALIDPRLVPITTSGDSHEAVC